MCQRGLKGRLVHPVRDQMACSTASVELLCVVVIGECSCPVSTWGRVRAQLVRATYGVLFAACPHVSLLCDTSPATGMRLSPPLSNRGPVQLPSLPHHVTHASGHVRDVNIPTRALRKTDGTGRRMTCLPSLVYDLARLHSFAPRSERSGCHAPAVPLGPALPRLQQGDREPGRRVRVRQYRDPVTEGTRDAGGVRRAVAGVRKGAQLLSRH